VKGFYKLFESDTVITSFDPNYPRELQPRDRMGRSASDNQIYEIDRKLNPTQLGQSPTTDTGAPTLNKRRYVTSGNGRCRAIRMNYERCANGDTDYKRYLRKNARIFGFSATAVNKLKRPILVRLVTDYGNLSEIEFAYRSNLSQVLGMGEAEQATADAKLLLRDESLLALFNPGESGNLFGQSNHPFLSRFVFLTGSRAQLCTKDGWNEKPFAQRLNNCFFAAVVDEKSPHLITHCIESSDGIKAVVNGTMLAASKLIGLKGSAYDIAEPYAVAFQEFIRLKQEGWKSSDSYFNQGSLFASSTPDDPATQVDVVSLVRFLSKANNAHKVKQQLLAYCNAAENAIIDSDHPQLLKHKPPGRPILIAQIFKTLNVPLTKKWRSLRNQ
jgi:hypothetical protein